MMRSVLAQIFLIVFTLWSLSSWSLEIPEEKYPFPTKDPFIATLFASFASGNVLEFNEWVIKHRPERKKIVELNYVIGAKVRYKKHKQKAPLIIIAPGLGGSSASGASLGLADAFFKQGYHVITVPSAFSFETGLSTYDSTLPGYAPRDAVDYYNLLKKIIQLAQTEKDFKVSAIHYVGYSYGASIGGYVSQVDNQTEKPVFSKFILINPALDSIYGISQLDRLYSQGDKLSQKYKNAIYGSVYYFASEKADQLKKDPVQSLFSFLTQYKYSTTEIQWLIGDQYRKSLGEIVMASHLYQNKGLLHSPYSKYKLNALGDESRTYTFKTYFEKAILPTLDQVQQAENFIYASSFYSQEEALKNDPRVFVFHNKDDFLLKPTDIDFLKNTFQERLFLFPYGGHMGNILAPEHLQMYFQLLK